MNCAAHPEVAVAGYCRNCGKPMCAACVRPVRDVLYCEDCLAQVMAMSSPAPPAGAPVAGGSAWTPGAAPEAAAPRATRSAAGAFFLGLVPGLGAIYNGEYNKAIVHIVIFATLILGLSLDLGGAAEALLTCGISIFPFYMAIDTVRSMKARESGTPVADPFESWSRDRALGPILLIGLGALFLLKNFGLFDFLRVREVFFPLLLIGLGVFLLQKRLGTKG